MHAFLRTGDESSYIPFQARKRGRKILDAILSLFSLSEKTPNSEFEEKLKVGRDVRNTSP